MKSFRKIIRVIIVFIVVLMFYSLYMHHSDVDSPSAHEHVEYSINEGWQLVYPDDPVNGEIDLPYAEKVQDSDTIVFRKVLPEGFAGMTMMFSCENADVRVIFDGEVIFQKKSADTSVDSRQYVTVPDTWQEDQAWGELCMELTVVNRDREIVLGDMVVGAGDEMIIRLLGRNLMDIICCLMILFSAVIMFVFALIRWCTNQQSWNGLFLGLFALMSGIYCFIGTDILNLFVDMQGIHVLKEYLMLLMPLVLALFFERNLGHVFPRRFAALLFVVCGNVAVQLILELLGVRDMHTMTDVSTVVLVLVCVMAIVSLVQWGDKGRGEQILLPVATVFVLLTAEVAKVILNYFSMYFYAKAVSLYGMALFGLLFAVLHVLYVLRRYRLDTEEKIKAAERQSSQLALAKLEADAARQEALAANEAKGKFLAQMSHEIRTPINVVLGMDEMILRESKEPAIREYAMDIRTSGQSLLSLINDILDFSKIDSGKMEIVPVVYEISSMIHDLVNMTLQRAKNKDLRFEVEIDPAIPSCLYGDDMRIRQVLVNILTNAVKYTEKGTVWLRILSRSADGTAVLRFEVEDTGIGIKEADLPKLCAEFERIEEDRNRSIEGTGLGMSITVQLLALMDSHLQVESTYGKGSKFYFELEQKIIDGTPIGDFESKVQQMAENFSYESDFCAPDAKLLVVDDNATNRRVFRNLLKETQVQVSEAGGGSECLRMVQENHYDLIFLDHMMPDMDGVETLHRMKALADFPCKDTPVIVLTANAVSGAKEAYLQEGFDEFLSKPIVPDKLEGMIRKMLPVKLLQAAEPKKTKAGQAETEAALDKLPVVEGLDWNYAWLHLQDMELLAYTVKEFYDQIDSAADCLARFYEQIEDDAYREQYRIQVHAMKSLAATVGIVTVSRMAKVLESAAKDGKIDTITSMTDIFLEEWRSYRQKLQGVFGIGTEERKEISDPSVIQALLEMVRISMQEMDIDRADELMGQLREYAYPDELEKNIQKLGEAVTNLDPEETDRLAGLISGQIAERKAE